MPKPIALKPETIREIIALADDMTGLFAPPEYIPGCLVNSVADKDEYATDNGWIEAVCGKHNQQRCRWRGQYSGVAVNDYVDVIYFKSFKLFAVLNKGGTGAISPATARAWPADGKAMIDTTEYDTLADAVTALTSGDTIKLGAGTFSVSTVTLTDDCHLVSADRSTIITSTDATTLATRANVTLQNLTIKNTHSATSQVKVLHINDNSVDNGDVVAINCEFIADVDTSGGSRAVRIDAGGLHRLLECDGSVANADGTSTDDEAISFADGDLEVRGGTWSGVDQDLQAYSTADNLILNDPIFDNSLVAIDSAVNVEGDYLDDTNNFVQPGSNDIYPNSRSAGVQQRLENWIAPTGYVSEVSWTWAVDAPFDGAPSTVDTSTWPDLMRLINNDTTEDHFYYTSVSPTASTGYVDMSARIALGAYSYVGVRLDAGNDNTYFEVRLVDSGTAGLKRLLTRYRSGGGGVTSTYTNDPMPPGFCIARAANFLSINKTLAYASFNQPLYIYNGVVQAVAWTPSRAGIIFGQRVGTGGDQSALIGEYRLLVT